jgi:5-methylcytosine-specific restriction protein A
MPSKGMSVCKKTGCSKLINKPGYCEPHTIEEQPYRRLDRNKTPEQKKFYSSSRWTKTSRQVRKDNPLCEECKKNGKTQKSEMVHHEPSREELIKRGLSPYDTNFLHALCKRCHEAEHRRNRKNC